MISCWQWDQVPDIVAKDDIVVLDVRTPKEHMNNGHIKKG